MKCRRRKSLAWDLESALRAELSYLDNAQLMLQIVSEVSPAVLEEIRQHLHRSRQLRALL